VITFLTVLAISVTLATVVWVAGLCELAEERRRQRRRVRALEHEANRRIQRLVFEGQRQMIEIIATRRGRRP
jgi:hypothetical protein